MQLARVITLSHRYLGIGLGILMVMWCMSGIVMVYVPYPRLVEKDRIAALAPLQACCRFPQSLLSSAASEAFEVEAIAGHAALRLTRQDRSSQLIDLERGKTIQEVNEQLATQVALQYEQHLGRTFDGYDNELIEYDQWTVALPRASRPFHKFSLHDANSTEIYVSQRSGKVVQVTTNTQRFWNWLGAIPHWLYPSILRNDVEAWSQVVIYTSLLGTLLAVTGLYLGVTQSMRAHNVRKRLSLFNGVWFWHHVPGLFFGLFVLSWVASGLLSMNPWGLLEVNGVAEDRLALRGKLDPNARWSGSIESEVPLVNLQAAPLNGALYVIGIGKDGSRVRYGVDGKPAPLDKNGIDEAAQRLAGARASWILLSQEDEYNYSLLQETATLPAILIVNPTTGSRYYLDATSGALLDKVDSGAKGYRWLHTAVHRLDFLSALRTPLARTFLMVPLLIGAAFVCGTGAYLGMRRLSRK